MLSFTAREPSPSHPFPFSGEAAPDLSDPAVDLWFREPVPAAGARDYLGQVLPKQSVWPDVWSRRSPCRSWAGLGAPHPFKGSWHPVYEITALVIPFHPELFACGLLLQPNGPDGTWGHLCFGAQLTVTLPFGLCHCSPSLNRFDKSMRKGGD